ncbi:MAG: hypothetical protein IKU25_05620 [Clostridia bacterium]|nr:hypothetical protein [Clostridia bacterium]
MELLKFIIKIIVMLSVVFLMATPLLFEIKAIKKDKKHKIRHKRLRIVLFTIAYVFVVALVLHVLGDLKFSLSQLEVFKWLGRKFAPYGRAIYFANVYCAVLVNIIIGFVFRIIKAFIRLRLRKKSLVVPEDKKRNQFTRRQKFERKLVKLLHNETWFFVSRVVKWFTILLSVAYALLFMWHQVPALFTADWLPYSFILSLFRSSYMYPMLSLLILWEFYFFVDGIRCVEEECPELLEEIEETKTDETDIDLDELDKECRRLFAAHYMGEVTADEGKDVANDGYDENVGFIGAAVENDSRNPKNKKETYMKCMNAIVGTDKSILVNGCFFSEFSMYLFRYLSIILARGENIALVCNNAEQVEDVYNYVKQGFSELTSLYAGTANGAQNFDTTIWKMSKVGGNDKAGGEEEENTNVDNSSILVTTLDYICSNEFERENDRFANLLDTIVFVDVLNTINNYPRKMAILNTRLLNITKNNAVLAKSNRNRNFGLRYMSKQVRYICFDDTRTPGIDRVLKNMLSVDFNSADAMADSGAMVRCYSYEGRAVGGEEPNRIRLLPTEEEISVVLNMALLCLTKGAKNVTVFVDDEVPYGNMRETIAANEANLSVLADGRLRLNKPFYNPDEYSVIIAVDSDNNLPATIRKYTAMAGDKKTLVMIFSPKYMLRDYYVDKVDELWKSTQIERIPALNGKENEVAQKIIVRANAGGISEVEILRLAGTVAAYRQYVADENVNGILREVLSVYLNVSVNFINTHDYFEFVTVRDFDEKGKFVTENKVILRQRGTVFDIINGRDMVVMVVGDEEVKLNVPKCRLTQNYIEGQKFIYNGSIYSVVRIDAANGKIYAHLADGGNNNEAYKYIQSRVYRVDDSEDSVVECVPRRHLLIRDRKDNKLGISEAFVSVFRAPTEVLTRGYYIVDPYTLDPHIEQSRYWSISDPGKDVLAKQTYRVYGMKDEERTYSADEIMKVADLNAYRNGALTMSLKIRGNYGGKKDVTATAMAVALCELLRAMFPSVADSVVVCPVWSKEFAEKTKDTLGMYPQLSLLSREGDGEDEIEVLIIEDSAEELGVVSTLVLAGDHVFKTLYTPLLSYIEWYFGSGAQSGYLNLGFDTAPDCFDFESLREVLRVFADDMSKYEFLEPEEFIESVECNFCGKRYSKGSGVIELEDGRYMCPDCAKSLVKNNKRELEEHLKRAKFFLESTYGIELGDDYDFCFESTIKIINSLKKNPELASNSTDYPAKSYVDKKKVYIEESVTSPLLSEMIVRQLTQIWQSKHLPNLEDELAQGHVALVGIQYLRFLNENALATVRARHYETSREISGVGYRRLVRELLANPKYNNNPFLYLTDVYGMGGTGGSGGSGDKPVVTVPKKTTYDDVDFGRSYTPETHDRVAPEKLNYYYYSLLSANLREMYTAIFDAMVNFQSTVNIDCSNTRNVETALKSVCYDHPELYYFNYNATLIYTDHLELHYLFTEEEVQAMNNKMEAEIQTYLACVDDSMSAYDVALRLQTKMIDLVDYDTVSLHIEESMGGPTENKLDYLRTICGVFLNRKVVCAGYAKAIQYLLQRCGVECGYCAGKVIEKDGSLGGGHAWNIVKMDGDYYYLDVTHNDQSSTSQKVKDNCYHHSFFCITTEELLRTRNLEYCPVEPTKCTATRCNYFVHNGLVFDTYDLDKIKELAKAAAKRGSKYVCFKFADKMSYGTARDKLLNRSDVFEMLRAASKGDRKICETNAESYLFLDRLYTATIWFKYE